MHLGFITTLAATPWGGSEELWSDVAAKALQEGHQVSIFATGWQKISPKLDELAKKGAKLHLRPQNFLGSLNSKMLKIQRRIKDPVLALKKSSPDVILVSQANPTDLVQDPRMHGFRDFLLTSGIPYLTLFQLVPEFLDLSNHRRKCLAEILHKAKENLFVSQRNEEVIRKTLLFDGSGSVVDNPIGFSPPKKVLDWPSEDEGLHFAIVGRLSCPHKGHDILMEALGSPAWRERKWTLNLYGDGADEEYLKTMATFYGLDARCLFHGHVSKAEEIWEKCHVCLLPSRMEGTPIVLLESMAAGRPAVVTDVGGNADCVKEGESGFVVPAPTVQLLLDGLEKLWDNQQRLESLGESAFGRFCQLRGLDRSTSHVLSLMTSQLR